MMLKKLIERIQVPVSLFGVAVCFVVVAPPAFSDEVQSAPPVRAQTGSDTVIPESPIASPVAGTVGAAGMTIYIDPQTGKFLKEPASGHVPLQLTPKLQRALSTSGSGLVEAQSPVPGGGVMFNLQGRFQSPLVITIDANGKAEMQHLNEVPGSGGKK